MVGSHLPIFHQAGAAPQLARNRLRLRSSKCDAELGPHARAATVGEAAKAGDIVVVSIPLKHYRTVPAEPLAGKVVIDTNNYYPVATKNAVVVAAVDVAARRRYACRQ
jgi:predicted dinucleotide-binding enzyme